MRLTTDYDALDVALRRHLSPPRPALGPHCAGALHVEVTPGPPDGPAAPGAIRTGAVEARLHALADAFARELGQRAENLSM